MHMGAPAGYNSDCMTYDIKTNPGGLEVEHGICASNLEEESC